MARRLVYYAGASTAAAAACLLKAFHQRPNFYSATVYLSQSNACILILTNLLLVTACWFMYGLQRALYGQLRPIEVEQLSEKAWYAVLDTLLAMPSFREDVGGWLLTMFALLLAGKVWGWIAEGRVDILEQQPPANPRLFHARLATSLIVSVVFDLLILRYCINTVITDPRPGMMVIFTFEFAILSIFSLFTLARYLLSVADTQIQKRQTIAAIEARKEEIRAEREEARRSAAAAGEPALEEDEEPIEVDENEVDVPGWEEKRRYLFALEVFTDFIKLLIYLFFFAVSVTFNGLPMHIMRDVYMTFMSFSKRVTDYVAYRRATSDMNARYPDATVEEIRGDVCIICRETMLAWEQPQAGATAVPAGEEEARAAANAAPAAPPRRRDEGMRAKKLPCGHILHLRCLKAWLERQQVCPTCRRPVVNADAPANGSGPAAVGANPGAGQQPHAPGQQPGQQQQPHQQPQLRRAARPRMFNLGPVRIGFLNGPQEQVQNWMNQFQNPGAAAAAINQQNQPQHQQQTATGGVASNGQSSEHATGTSIPTTFTGASSGQHHSHHNTLPIQIQLMQIEQRLVQEAQNLALEQQQLLRLRALEADLAMLRAQRAQFPPPVGISTASRPQAGFIPGPTSSSPFPAGGAVPEEVLRGSPAVQWGAGHEHLPPGMVLPEGWTVMPLTRIGDDGRGASPGPAAASGSAAATPAPPPTSVSSPAAVSSPAGVSTTGQPPQQQPTQPQSPPPPQTSPTGSTTLPWSQNHSAGWNFSHPTRAAAAGPTSNPMTRSPSQPPNHSPAQTKTVSPTPTTTQPEPASPAGYAGKGKAKAVEVEDAEDE